MNNEEKYVGYCTHADGPWGSQPVRDIEAYELAQENAGRLNNAEGDLSDIKNALNYPDGTITWFGIKKPVGDAQCEGVPCGNLLRLRMMKNIFRLGGYMVKNNHTRRKLSPNDHRYYEDDGSAVVFTGADGHYQWGWGVDIYYANWTEDGYEYEVVDDRQIYGHPCVKIPVGSVSATGRCAIDRTNLILCGYISDDPQYRGGTNEASYDNTWRSQLQSAVTNINVITLAGYARKNGNLWFANERVSIFVVGLLMRIFFHNSHIQAPFIEGVDENGLHRGGLGQGIDYSNDVEWSTRGYGLYVKLSTGIEKGDFLGLLSTTIKKSDDSDLVIGNIPCFFGLKNWYKSLWVMEEDSLLVCNSNKTQSMYVKKVIDGQAIDMSTVSGLQLVGATPAHESGSWSPIKQISKAYLSGMPTQDGGSYDTFFGDGYYNPAVTDGTVRGSIRLGSASHGDAAGSCVLDGSDAPSYALANGGAVLCEFAESFDTELTTVNAE